MFRRAFWVAAIERATKTFAQTTIALVAGDEAFNFINVNWGDTFSIAGSGAVLSFLMSLASIPLSPGESPSLVPAAEIEAATR